MPWVKDTGRRVYKMVVIDAQMVEDSEHQMCVRTKEELLEFIDRIIEQDGKGIMIRASKVMDIRNEKSDI